VAGGRGGTRPESKKGRLGNQNRSGGGDGDCAAQGYKASMGWRLETGFRRDRSRRRSPVRVMWCGRSRGRRSPPGFRDGRPVSRPPLGTGTVSPGQIPIIPSMDRLLLKDRVEAAKTSVGAAEAGRAAGKAMQFGRNGPNESRAGTPESASWKAKAGWRWRESHRMERSRIPWVSSCCRTATNGCGTQLLGDAPGWRRRTSPAERTMAKRAQEKKYKTLTV
jgi:hypothetical protein